MTVLLSVLLVWNVGQADWAGWSDLDNLLTTTINQTTEQSVADQIVAAAKKMTESRIGYRMRYPSIDFPGGDVAATEGLCCDVVVRALRAAGIDLQVLMYADFQKNRSAYEQLARQTFRPGVSSDWLHRRTALINYYLSRHAVVLPTAYSQANRDQWQPGDIVIYRRQQTFWHIAVVSATPAQSGRPPQIIDAWQSPGYVSERHTLTSHGTIGGHYRLTDEFRAKLPLSHQIQARSAWGEFVTDAVTKNRSLQAPRNRSVARP